MTSSTVAESLPASLVAVIVQVPSKSLVRPERVRLSRSLLNTPMRLEKVVIRKLVGMLKLFPFKSLKVHWMFSACTSGEVSEMVKVKVTLIPWIPTILPWTAWCLGSTVGGTEGGGGGGGERTSHDSSSAVCNVVCWWMRPEVQLVQVAGVASLRCIWCCVVEGLPQYLAQ